MLAAPQGAAGRSAVRVLLRTALRALQSGAVRICEMRTAGGAGGPRFTRRKDLWDRLISEVFLEWGQDRSP